MTILYADKAYNYLSPDLLTVFFNGNVNFTKPDSFEITTGNGSVRLQAYGKYFLYDDTDRPSKGTIEAMIVNKYDGNSYEVAYDLDYVSSSVTPIYYYASLFADHELTQAQASDKITAQLFKNNDELNGSDFSDKLNGYTGRDTLTGNDGNDTFYFTTKATTYDIITDFSNSSGNNDRIALSNAIFPHINGHISSAFQDVTHASQKEGAHLLYNQSTGTLKYDADGHPGGSQVTIAIIQHHVHLTAGDFLFV